jgi:decaprenyl-phosphate phosphoribosyltransferase
LVIAGVATLVAYLLYTRSPHTVAFFGTHHLMWTAPFPAIGLFRFGMILRRGDTHESPTEEMLKDPVFLINMAVWATSVLAIIYVL